MKIAFIYDSVYPWVKGGAERRVYELAKRLVERGHEVHWYTMGFWMDENSKMSENMDLEGIHLHSVCKPVELYTSDRRSIKEAIYFAIKLLRPLMRENFDVVDCQGFPFFSCFTAKLHSLTGRSKLVITFHEVWGGYWYEYLGKLGVFGKMVEKLTFKLTDHTITVSKKTMRDLEDISGVKSIVIPNGIDFKEIESVEVKNPGIKTQPIRNSDVIYAGRLIKEKNLELLLESIETVRSRMPEVKCLIIGEGPEREKLEKIVLKKNLKDNIKFMGFLEDHKNLISLMKSSKVFVLPSKREGFGMVVVEANACGLPVVVYEHEMNAARDLIDENVNGFIAKDSKDMAEKIIMGIDNHETMSDACITSAKRYDWDGIVQKLEEVYTSQVITE
ncbi:glycosyltransferase family 4 protein [Methanobacterium congolense]|uniref:Putative glycosyltransferase MJ1178 n=1 Tax=Methanobacterium congolense TaxID=118062 RepID=A0A1D3L1X9_9EURY|nr:glycosyltransferase family 4 protein [Methanobacterium congolense]SCG85543.1 putative glycosyltransferase MJ1178 [Methanobacterium congolense]